MHQVYILKYIAHMASAVVNRVVNRFVNEKKLLLSYDGCKLAPQLPKKNYN